MENELTQGRVAIIDEEDWPIVSAFKWYAHHDQDGRWYAYARHILRAMRPKGGTPEMIHELTVGHLDHEALRGRRAVATSPLDLIVLDQVAAEFPGLKISRRDGYVVVPWHGREDAARGEGFAVRMQALTGCMVADRRNGRIIDLAVKVPAV
ncbi:hypothetical protein ACYOEI_04935 [Singulisphaera rosea]